MNLVDRIEGALGRRPARTTPLAGGCVGEVYRVDFEDGERLVAKSDASARGQLDLEGAMLAALAPHLPVPAVIHAAPDLLLMEFLEGASSFSAGAERHAAELLAALHRVTASDFGFERDTLIGGLHQANPWTGSWLAFFAEHRLSAMATQCRDTGRVDAALVRRVETLAGRLARWLTEPAQPSLLHGDVWSGNVLAQGDRIAGFLDPACYYGDPEIELAFTTLFSSFGKSFFARYQQLRAIAPGFHEERRHLYNLYPLLVHVRLFGGRYVSAVEQTLRRFGC